MDKIEKLEDIEMIVKYNADKFLKQLNKVVEELEKLEHTEIKGYAQGALITYIRSKI